jgi:hypothetical protein
VRSALATLPWVEHGSIKTDIDTQDVRFKIKGKESWNEDAIRAALKKKSFPEMTVKSIAP